jgi:hypothetical protein
MMNVMGADKRSSVLSVGGAVVQIPSYQHYKRDKSRKRVI